MRSGQALKPIPGHRARARLRPADLGQPTGARSRDAVAGSIGQFADRIARIPRHRRPRDLREGRQSRAVDPPEQRRGRRSRHHRAAGRGDDPTAGGRRHGQLLARPRTARTTRSTCSCRRSDRQVASDIGNLYLTTNSRGPDGRAADGSACGRSPTSFERRARRSSSGRTCSGASRIYANAEGRPSGDVGSDVQKVMDAMQLPPGYRLHGGGSAEGHAGFVQGRAGRARARGDLHLPDPRVTVRELHAAARDHGVAAVLADRRVPRAAR